MQSGLSVWHTSRRNARVVAMATEWLNAWIGCVRRHMLNAERGCLCQRGRKEGVDLCGWLSLYDQHWSAPVELKL